MGPANADAARLAIERARETVSLLDAQVRSADVRAPIEGTVYALPVRVGNRVETGTTLAQVADLRAMQIRAFVDEPELAAVREGLVVEVSWSAESNRVWKGHTERVPKNVVPRGDRMVGEVICSVKNDDEQLVPNLGVDVRIRLQGTAAGAARASAGGPKRSRRPVRVRGRRRDSRAAAHRRGRRERDKLRRRSRARRRRSRGAARRRRASRRDACSNAVGGRVTSHVRKPREAISALAVCAALILCLVQARQSAYAASHETSQSVADPTIEQARHLFADGRYDESAKALASVETPSAPVLFWLGRAQFELHDYPAAIQTLERGVALAPDDAEMHRWLGRAYGEEANRKSSFSLAIRVRRQFEEAVRLDPMNLDARRDLLEFYLEAPRLLGGGDDKARRQVAAITAVDPVAGHLASARLARDHGDAARVNAEYRAVFEAKPADVEPYFEAAEYYEARNDADGLRAAADGVARLAPNDPRLSYILGVLRVIEGGAFASAETSLKAYLTVPPRSDRPGPASTHEWLGRLYEESGALVRAVAEYRAALALEPGRKFAKESLRRLGRLLPK